MHLQINALELGQATSHHELSHSLLHGQQYRNMSESLPVGLRTQLHTAWQFMVLLIQTEKGLDIHNMGKFRQKVDGEAQPITFG